MADRRPDAWLEVGDRVFSRRYAFLDQQIGAILTEDGPVVVDTRTSARQAHEIAADLHALTRLPVAAVIDTHHHWDHTFGNGVFRPAPIWGHRRCAERLRRDGPARRQVAIDELPEMADELRETEIDPPDRTFEDAVVIEVGGRPIELRFEGRGHTDNDIVVLVTDASVMFAGDLVENNAPPYFDDGYPLDWPATLVRVRAWVTGAVVPGHGDVGEAPFVDRMIVEIGAIADLAREVASGVCSLADAVARAPYPAAPARSAIERTLTQLRGELVPDGLD